MHRSSQRRAHRLAALFHSGMATILVAVAITILLTPVAHGQALDSWLNCQPSVTSPVPDAAGQSNIQRANQWSLAASDAAFLKGFGTGRYDWLRCRGDVVAAWLDAGGPSDVVTWLGRQGHDSPLGACTYQLVVNRPATAANLQLVVTMNDVEHQAIFISCDPSATTVCTYSFSAPCELEREATTARFVGPVISACLHGDTGKSSDGACEVNP